MDPQKKSRTLAVYELEQGAGQVSAWFSVTMSIPGREGTVRRSWVVGPAGLTEPDLTDLTAWMLDQVTMAILFAAGAQRSLPM